MRPGHKATDKKKNALNFHDTHSCRLQEDTAYRNHNKEAFVFTPPHKRLWLTQMHSKRRARLDPDSSCIHCILISNLNVNCEIYE